jgi:hypothetical protein
MEEKILGTVVMVNAANNGVTMTKSMEVIKVPNAEQSTFRSRIGAGNHADRSICNHGPFSVQSLRAELEKGLEDGYVFQQINDEFLVAPMSIDYVLGRLHIGFMSADDWMGLLFGNKARLSVTFDPGHVAPVW